MMGAHTNWVDISALEGRLDSRYYSATATTSRARVRSYGATKKLGELCKRLDCGPFGSTLTEDEHDPAGDVILVQPTDITAPLFTSEPGWRITRATQRAKSLKPYPAATVFFARVGYPHTGVLPSHFAGSTISSKIIAAVVNEEEVDPYFLHSFLRSRLGQTILVSMQKVTAQPTLGTSDLALLEVPYPDPSIQRAIGNKVRKAERLRELAAADWRSGIDATLVACGTSQLDGAGRLGFAEARWIDSARLDAKFYLPGYLRLRSEMNQVSRGQTLRDLVKQVSNGCEIRDFVERGRPYLVVGNLRGMDLRIDGAPHISTNERVPKKAIPTAGDLLIVRTGSIGQASWLLPEDADSSQLVLSSHLIRFVLRDATWAPFLAVYFTHGPGRSFIDQIAYGAVQPQLSQDELLAVPIPRTGSDVRTAVADALGSWRQRTRSAESAVDEARSAVEALIDGTLDEPALLAEGEAIEQWLAENPTPMQPNDNPGGS